MKLNGGMMKEQFLIPDGYREDHKDEIFVDEFEYQGQDVLYQDSFFDYETYPDYYENERRDCR